MGFLDAVKALGQMEAEKLSGTNKGNASDPFREFADFLELPMPLSSRQTPKVIRVWCKSSNIEKCLVDETIPLDILGIEKIDCVDYGAGGDTPDSETVKRKTLYRSPVGSNVTWSFTPLYKLGKSKKTRGAVLEELAGVKLQWKTNNKTRLFKLKKNILQAFEEEGTWAEGSLERLIKDLENNLDRLSDLWIEANTSTILVFGFHSLSGEFLWPGEIPGYRKYFLKKMQPNSSPKAPKKETSPLKPWHCASCSSLMSGEIVSANVSDVFSFATFDKPGFLPGASKSGDASSTLRKVWPLCRSCYGMLSRGRSYLDENYVRGDILPGLNLFVVPEFVASESQFSHVDKKAQLFLKNGIRMEERLFQYLAKQGDSLVFHFLVWEKNKAQELVHLLIEDVPPTRLKRLESKWREAAGAFPFPSKDEQMIDQRTSLDFAFKSLLRFFLSSSKNDGEKKWLKNKALAVWGKLLGGKCVDVSEVKSLAVSRFSACFADEKWMKYAGLNMIDMARVVDFLIRTNVR